MNDLPLRPAASSAQTAMLPSPEETREVELSVVVPAYNERDNVAELIGRLDSALRGIAWEVIYVDDFSPIRSLPQGAWALSHEATAKVGAHQAR